MSHYFGVQILLNKRDNTNYLSKLNCILVIFIMFQFHASVEGKLPQYNTRVKLPQMQRDLVYDGKNRMVMQLSILMLSFHYNIQIMVNKLIIMSLMKVLNTSDIF